MEFVIFANMLISEEIVIENRFVSDGGEPMPLTKVAGSPFPKTSILSAQYIYIYMCCKVNNWSKIWGF